MNSLRKGIHRMPRYLAFALFGSGLFCAAARADLSFNWSPVGNAGNAADTTGFGAVSYNYRISQTEVTNAQYAEFLNAVAATDAHGLYSPYMNSSTQGGITRSGVSGSYTYSVKPAVAGQGPGGSEYAYDNKPVVFVSFFDAMRFVNWLHNGQGSGNTETGVYSISDGVSESRAANANYWIPSEDEWYKAAYHDAAAGTAGTYFDFATASNATPDNNLPTNDSGNSANFNAGDFSTPVYTTGSSDYPMIDVGAYTLSDSAYGTFDQAGNVWEWNEAVIDISKRGLRGGSWYFDADALAVGFRNDNAPAFEGDAFGFRVATAAAIPEASPLLFGALASMGLAILKLRKLSRVGTAAGCK
ncbi:MAG: PEP-CTERM sorting domain-containing protein [Planctomycetaceae bacterium]|nr:PEP-CTERM sorting domain-containing protein [Planctomycetaceae bacterium]